MWQPAFCTLRTIGSVLFRWHRRGASYWVLPVISPPVMTGCMTHPFASCPKLWVTSKSTSRVFYAPESSSAPPASVTLSPDCAKLGALSWSVAGPPHGVLSYPSVA